MARRESDSSGIPSTLLRAGLPVGEDNGGQDGRPTKLSFHALDGPFSLAAAGKSVRMRWSAAEQVGIFMYNILNQLIQLQELNFAKEEQKASNSKMPLGQLEKSIAKIRAQLPEGVADRYDRLQKHYPVAVVPLASGSCSRCGLAVPANVVNGAKAGEEMPTCPHWGRFLFFPDTVGRQTKKK